MSFEQQAQDRKSRLAALRNKRKPVAANVEEPEQPQKKQAPERIISRNFDPETQEHKAGFNLPPTTQDENSETVEAVSQKIQDDILKKFQTKVDQGFESSNRANGHNIRKKTTTSDFMRDLQPKLDILNERTDESIKKLLKERIRKLREDATPTTE